MKYIFLVAFFHTFYLFDAEAQIVTRISWTEKTSMPSSDVIYYNASKKLKWADFNGMPGPPSPVAAITASGFGYKASMQSTNGKGHIDVAIYCYFSKINSWVKPASKTAYVLTHEQHHFDATYLAAKLFTEKVKASSLSTTNMDALLAKLYKESCSYMNELQNNYDGETKNGQLSDKQEKWNTFFDNKLMNNSKIDFL